MKKPIKSRRWTKKAILEALSSNVQLHMTYFEKELSNISVAELDGINVVFSAIKSEAYNYAVNFQHCQKRGSNTLELLFNKFKERRKPFTWWVGPLDKPKTLLPKLEALGLKQSDVSDGMYLVMDKFKSKYQGSVPIKRVLKAAELKDFHRVLSVFDEDILSFKNYWKLIPAVHYGKKAPVEMYIGYLNKKPVTAGMLCFEGDSAGIYYISTLPEVRGKGLATEMLHFLLERVEELGYPIAVLQASPEGKGIYSKAGFKSCGNYWEYMLPSFIN